jgi:hypothetical protein
MSEQSPQELSLKTAELLGRQLFSAFMNLSGYGREHPVTKKSIDALFSNLSELARQLYGLTLLLERDQLYAEKHPIGSRERARRLVGIFGDIGLESVSFEPEIDKNSLEEFLLILTTPKNFSSPEEIREELVRRGASRIRLNYVVFRKLTRDQHVSEGSEDPRLETDRIGTGDAAKAGQQTGAPVLQQPPAKTNGRPRATSPKLPERVLSAANIAYFLGGARGRNRTGTDRCRRNSPRDFKSLASTNFATRADPAHDNRQPETNRAGFTGRNPARKWRLGPESNRGTRLCRPLHNHSAT